MAIINIEEELFTIIATKLRAEYKGIFVTGEETDIPTKFPAVSIVEVDNYTQLRTQTSTHAEYSAQLMYEVNVYSNKTKGKKSEAKAIFATIDTELSQLGFTRTGKTPINMTSATIYRLVGRWQAVATQNKTIYRR